MGYFDDNAAALASWESKWLDPDYDLARGRYYDDEDDDDEEEYDLVDNEVDDAINYIFGLER